MAAVFWCLLTPPGSDRRHFWPTFPYLKAPGGMAYSLCRLGYLLKLNSGLGLPVSLCNKNSTIAICTTDVAFGINSQYNTTIRLVCVTPREFFCDWWIYDDVFHFGGIFTESDTLAAHNSISWPQAWYCLVGTDLRIVRTTSTVSQARITKPQQQLCRCT